MIVKKVISPYLLILFFLVTYSYSFRLEGEKLKTTQYITNHIINNRYDSAIVVANAVTDKNDPLFAVLKLAAAGMRDVDYEQIVDSAQFLSLFIAAESSITLYTNKNGVSSYSQLLLGMTKAMHAIFYLRQKKYIAAMKNGFDAIDLMKKAQESDSLNYEVDFFLGLYEYAQSELKSKLWWVLFWYPGNREQGIKRINRAAENGYITVDAAKLSLCDIYLHNNKSNEAYSIIRNLKLNFPESRFVLWAEVKYCEILKQYHEAAEIYGNLSESYSRDTAGEYNSLVTAFHKARVLNKAGDFVNAELLCDEINKHKAISRYKDLRKDIQKLRERNNVSQN